MNFSCLDSNEFKIFGNLKNGDGKKVYLIKGANASSVSNKIIDLDSCLVKNNMFTFKGELEESNFYSIYLKDGIGWKYFILSNNDKIILTGNADTIWNSKIEGSYENQLYSKLNLALIPLTRKSNDIADSISLAWRNGNNKKVKEYKNEYQFLKNQILNTRIDFIKRNPNTFASLSQLLKINRDKENSILSTELLGLLSKDIQKHSIYKRIKYNLFDLSKIKKKKVSFEQTDTSGRTIEFNNFIGNYILIEFWASWCAPCIEGFPYLKEVYEKYNHKGFNIIGVSLDHDKDKWIKAINSLELNWVQLSDLKGSKNLISEMYNVKSIPYNLLIDENGFIIKENIRPEELELIISKLY